MQKCTLYYFQNCLYLTSYNYKKYLHTIDHVHTETTAYVTIKTKYCGSFILSLNRIDKLLSLYSFKRNERISKNPCHRNTQNPHRVPKITTGIQFAEPNLHNRITGGLDSLYPHTSYNLIL